MIFIVSLCLSYLLLVFGLITLIWKYRRSENRSFVVAVFSDKVAVRAVFVGTAFVLFVLVTSFTSDIFHGALIGVPTALIGGFAVAAFANWFSERRGNSKEG